MTDTIIIALITAVPPTIVAGVAVMQAKQAKRQVNEIHLSVNSRMDELLKLTRKEATLEATVAESERIDRKEGV
jgi:Na+-translocating ferredoxin:NAD+ oxidoreductase RnfG subunit